MEAQRHDAVLFDFDGVLVDSEPLHFSVWTEVAARLGLTFEWDWYRRAATGVADSNLAPVICEVNGRPDLVEPLMALVSEKKRLFAERIRLDPPMPASVQEMLATLMIPMALVSSSFRAEIQPALDGVGLTSRFRAIVCGEDVANLKPHPEAYLKAAGLLGASNPLVVEDSDVGAAAGKAAGFMVLRVTNAAETAAKVFAHLGGQAL